MDHYVIQYIKFQFLWIPEHTVEQFSNDSEVQ